MRCLYCGKEYWLPSQIRRDPDFCSVAHREKYNSLVERAMRCIQDAAPLPASESMPAPVLAVPASHQPSREAEAAPEPATSVRAAADTGARLSESPVPPPAGARAAVPETLAPTFRDSVASDFSPRADLAARLDKAGAIAEPRPSRFRASPHMPPLAASPVFERLEKEAARVPDPEAKTAAENTPDQKETAAQPMFSLLETSGVTRRKAGRLVLIAAAACLAVGGVLWTGINAARFGKRLFSPAVSETSAPKIAAASEPAARTQPASFQHSLEWFRSAALQHAMAHLSESFETGMGAWGVPSRAWAPGWSHSPDGYVRPGQLALFQPTLGYADYRMEFLGEIENKSMSWVVRGKDPRNYYAMKLTLVRPGLRPLLSLAHFPVVDGKPGRTVEVPLSVMIHNDIPYHIAVEVQGSTYRVWLEGEPVDSWSDDKLPAGGVGFFSEAGARARIYWVNVSKNDDWLGWLCAHITGDPTSRTNGPRGAI